MTPDADVFDQRDHIERRDDRKDHGSGAAARAPYGPSTRLAEALMQMRRQHRRRLIAFVGLVQRLHRVSVATAVDFLGANWTTCIVHRVRQLITLAANRPLPEAPVPLAVRRPGPPGDLWRFSQRVQGTHPLLLEGGHLPLEPADLFF